TGYWQDQRTLVIEPSAKLEPSTRYDVTLDGELGKRTAQFRFSFVHQPLAVVGLWSDVTAEMIPTDGPIPLELNLPVLPSNAAAHCKLTDKDKAEIRLAAGGASTAPATQLALKPVRALVPGAAYTLTCADLTGA